MTDLRKMIYILKVAKSCKTLEHQRVIYDWAKRISFITFDAYCDTLSGILDLRREYIMENTRDT